VCEKNSPKTLTVFQKTICRYGLNPPLKTTLWVKKGCHHYHGYNFVNSWSICCSLQQWKNFANRSRIDKVI